MGEPVELTIKTTGAEAKNAKPEIASEVSSLVAAAGIAPTDTVEVHYAVSQEGKWAVLRVSHVLSEED